MKRILALALLAASGMASVAMAQEGETTALEDLIVVAPSPLGGGVSLSRLGETISSVGSEELAKTGSLSIGDALQQNISGVNVSDTQGNAFTGDVNYRGFTASALQGLPQGLAVYLNGQRLNEAFGDTMNWDLIPQVAIAQIDLVTSNPAFGLNAIGGALSLRTRDGFGFHGLDASAQTGAFGTQIGTLQGGWSNNTTSLYAAVDGGKIDGWRPNGGSSVARAFGDLGYKTAKSEVHVVAGVSDTRLGVVGPTPVDLLEDDRKAIFTFPQTSHNNARFAAANGKLTLDDHWSLQGGVHTRRFQQTHLDGNDGDFERCAATGPMANTLCLVRDGFPTSIPDAEFQLLTPVGAPIACPVSNVDADGCRNQISSLDGPRVPYGTLDRTATNTTTAGASLQLSNNAKLGERKNSLNVGGAYDSSDIRFNSHSTLAIIDPALLVTAVNYPLPDIPGAAPGLGQIIHSGPDVAYGPADIDVKTRTAGLFASDTLDLTADLSVTLGARYNSQEVDLKDLTGVSPDLNGNHKFNRFNPAINFAWRTGAQTFYGGYAETNRAPTPLELSCSDPDKPCLLENSLVSDPPLKQVISRTFEIGTRGGHDQGKFSWLWTGSAFSTTNTDDIVSLASNLTGRGYFSNVPKTRRIGYDAQINVSTNGWSAFLGYSHVDATYEFTGTLASPNNPQADANGNIAIQPGDHIGAIPAQRIKAGADVTLFDKLTLNLDAQYTGSQYVAGDEGNDNPRLPGYWTAGIRADYALTSKVTAFVMVDNLFNENYASFGTYFDAGGVQKIRPQPFGPDPEELSVTPGAPRAVYFGLKAKY